MKRKLQIPAIVLLLVVLVIGISSCVDHQERYQTPPWLGGSSIEILEKRGNYKHFLALMDSARYRDIIASRLYTLFVPDDAAFEKYFQSAGIQSVASLTKDQAINLFTLHILRNPRSRFQLIYEWAWSELQGPKGEYASLFHRKPTPSTSIPYRETPKYHATFKNELIIYTGNKNVPLFTAEWFNDYGGARDGSDYLFMYPGSTWELGYPAGMKGINWHNAMVIPNPEIPTELEVRTATGFIYFLDRVVPPMPSIEEYMIANQNRFGLYYDILQRFAQYTEQKTDEQNRVQYRKTYDLVFDLAHERGPSTGTAVPPQNMWTAFLPSDQVLQQYLNNTVLKYYNSIDEVPRVTLYYILQTQLSATLVIPSKMEKSYFNAFGDATEMSRNDIVSSYMCSNGVVYESKKVLEPNVFTCVPGILFFDKNYSTLLFLLNQANMLSSLSNPNADVTLFAANNDAMLQYGVRYNSTTTTIEQRGPDNVWRPMTNFELSMFAQDQVFKGKLTGLDGPEQFTEVTSGNFIRYGNNQVGSAENQAFKTPGNITEVEVNERNGLLVKVDYPIGSRFVMGKYLAGTLLDPDVSEFARLLTKANLLDARASDPVTRENIPNLKFLAANKYWTGLIPTNAAIQEARNAGIPIPSSAATPAWTTEQKDFMDKFLKYHFIQGTVVFNDGKLSGNFDTHSTYRDPLDRTKILNAKLRVINSPGNLVLQDISGRQVPVNNSNANFLVRKGVMHKVNSVLLYYNK